MKFFHVYHRLLKFNRNIPKNSLEIFTEFAIIVSVDRVPVKTKLYDVTVHRSRIRSPPCFLPWPSEFSASRKFLEEDRERFSREIVYYFGSKILENSSTKVVDEFRIVENFRRQKV